MFTQSISHKQFSPVEKIPEPVSLQTRASSAQMVSQEDPTLPSPPEEPSQQLQILMRYLTTMSIQDPRDIIDLLQNLEMDDGTKIATSMNQMSALLYQAKAELQKLGGPISPQLEFAMQGATVQLWGLASYFRIAQDRVFFPTEENGGAIIEYY